jgi:hypothetical protein
MATAKSFQDLEVWKLGRDLRRKLYEVAKSLPAHERYNLVAQIKAAAGSLTSNIAEGFGGIITRRIYNSAASPEAPPASLWIISRHA